MKTALYPPARLLPSCLADLLQCLVLPHVLLVQLLHQVVDHGGLHMQQDVPPVIARHHAVLQQEQQVAQRCVHLKHLSHRWRHSQHVELKRTQDHKDCLFFQTEILILVFTVWSTGLNRSECYRLSTKTRKSSYTSFSFTGSLCTSHQTLRCFS